MSRGKIERQSFETTILPKLRGNKSTLFKTPEVMVDILKNQNVIILYDEYGEIQVKITDQFREDVKSFIRNGMMSSQLGSLVVVIKKYLKTV